MSEPDFNRIALEIAQRVLFHASCIRKDLSLDSKELAQNCVTTFTIYDLEELYKKGAART